MHKRGETAVPKVNMGQQMIEELMNGVQRHLVREEELEL